MQDGRGTRDDLRVTGVSPVFNPAAPAATYTVCFRNRLPPGAAVSGAMSFSYRAKAVGWAVRCPPSVQHPKVGGMPPTLRS